MRQRLVSTLALSGKEKKENRTEKVKFLDAVFEL